MKVELAEYLAEMTKNTRVKEAEKMLAKDPENENLQKLVKMAKAKARGNMKKMKAKLFCKTCGSENLEQLEWRKVNTGKFVELYVDDHQDSTHPYWCTVCEINDVEVTTWQRK